MRTLLEAAIIALGAWLCLSPVALGYAEPIAIVLSVGMGVLSVVCACIGLRSKTVQINFMVLVAAGLCFAVWGLVGSLGLAWINGVNEVIVGLLIACLSAICLPLQLDVEKASFYNRGGSDLASISKMSEKKGNLLAKTVLLGSMPETIFIRPEELCKLLSLMDFQVVAKLPGMLFEGWKRNRVSSEEK
ncbi:hypothetical protein AALA69_06985 [Eggerthellaceae bacterium 24-137]